MTPSIMHRSVTPTMMTALIAVLYGRRDARRDHPEQRQQEPFPEHEEQHEVVGQYRAACHARRSGASRRRTAAWTGAFAMDEAAYRDTRNEKPADGQDDERAHAGELEAEREPVAQPRHREDATSVGKSTIATATWAAEADDGDEGGDPAGLPGGEESDECPRRRESRWAGSAWTRSL